MATAGLTADQTRRFHEEGYLCLENVLDGAALDPLIAEFASVIDRESRQLRALGKIDSLFEEHDFQTRLAKLSEQSPKAFQAVFHTIHTGPAIFDLIRNPRLLDIEESLVGPEI